MKTLMTLTALLFSANAFATTLCEVRQQDLIKAKQKYDLAEQALSYSYDSCPQAPNAQYCRHLFQDDYETTLAQLRAAALARNAACAAE